MSKAFRDTLKSVVKPADTAPEVIKEDEMKDKETQVDETTAGDSLHPAARAIDDPKSKFSMISNAIGAMHAMSSDELTKWYTQSVAQIGHEADKVPGSSDKNSSTIDMKGSAAVASSAPKTKDPMPKLSAKEDVEALFDGQELSEDFKEQVTVLFETALNARVILEQAKLEEAFEVAVEEAVEEIAEDLIGKIDTYLDYVVEQFLDENKLAVESTLRNELSSEFIEGLREFFLGHNVLVPEAEVDVVEALSDKVAELEAALNEQINESIELKDALAEVDREKVVDTFVEGLTLSEADKFLKLVEGIDFDGDLEAYGKKLEIVKENYFSGKQKTPGSTNIESESFEGDSTKTVNMDPTIARYMASISKINK